MRKEKTKNILERIANLLSAKFKFILVILLLACSAFSFFIFNVYVANPQEKEFDTQLNLEVPDYELYQKIAEERLGKVIDQEGEETDEEGEGDIDEEKVDEEEAEDEEGDEEEREETDEDDKEETDEDDELPTDEDLENNNISDEELEDFLANTLFELYEFTEGSLPTVSERAKVWEDLGLGGQDEYVGSRSQNIKFLEELKEKMDNNKENEEGN